MEASNFSETQPEGLPKRQLSLSSEIIEAVSEVVRNTTGNVFALQPALFSPAEVEADPAQVAMAVAYTNLCIEEPEMVTSRHKQMLRSAFSYEQIQDLTGLIKKMLQ